MKLLKFICVIAILFTSCKSKQGKKISLSPNCKYNITTADSLVTIVKTMETDSSNNFRIRADADVISNNSSVSFNMQIRLTTNEYMWISIKKAGFPLAKALLTPDTFKLIDIINKKYKVGTFEEISEILGADISFELLQGMLLSKPQIDQNEKQYIWNEENDFILSNKDESVLLSHIANKMKLTSQTLTQWLNCNFFFLTKSYYYNPTKKQDLWIDFSQPDTTQGFWMNKNIKFKVNQNDSLKIKGELSIKDIDLKKDLNLPFNIPSDYEEMD